MDKSREQFEAWFNSKSNWKIVTTMRTKTGYTNNPSAQSKWEVWQASRAAVELPVICECCHSEEKVFISQEIYNELGDQGVGE